MAGGKLNMRDDGKYNILGIRVNSVDYEAATAAVINAATERRPLKVTALAVHGIMTGIFDQAHRFRLNAFNYVTPDGQPVRWALNLLHKCKLTKRVYGPDLMLEICAGAARKDISIYLYGSSTDVLDALALNLANKLPSLKIAGTRASLFRLSAGREKQEIIDEIKSSGASIVFVGLGCPRQEVFVYEYAAQIGLPCIAVGAAFDFHAGLLVQAPGWMQDRGLEWLFRLFKEPVRLWRRYILLNPAYLFMLALQSLRIRQFQDIGTKPTDDIGYA